MSLPGDADGGLDPAGQLGKLFSIVADPTDAHTVYVGGDRQPGRWNSTTLEYDLPATCGATT